jgi:hypothetical protein
MDVIFSTLFIRSLTACASALLICRPVYASTCMIRSLTVCSNEAYYKIFT